MPRAANKLTYDLGVPAPELPQHPLNFFLRTTKLLERVVGSLGNGRTSFTSVSETCPELADSSHQLAKDLVGLCGEVANEKETAAGSGQWRR
jgi:hypothetical protein